MIIALLAIVGGIVFLLHRSKSGVETTNTFDHNSKGLSRQARDVAGGVFGTDLRRVQDARLAAVILMLQLVSTGSYVTAAEKTKIMELMEDPLRIADIEAMLRRARTYTRQSRAFSSIATELLPLLRKKLTIDERQDLIEMLTKVANAYSEASELRIEAIARLRMRLMMSDLAAARR